MAASAIPAKWTGAILKRRGALADALLAHNITEDRIAKGIADLLDAKKRVVIYAGNGERASEYVVDGMAVRAGIELTFELWGLRNAKAIEGPETDREENDVMADALSELAMEKARLGWTPESFEEWIRTPEGLDEFKKRGRELVEARACGVEK